MKFFKLYLLLSLVLPALAFAQPPSGPPGPAITFDKSSVSVAGVSAKGKAVLFSVAREVAEDDVATIVRGNSHADQVADARAFAEVLLVRPGAGAWQLTVGDGSASDDDGAADGKLTAALDTRPWRPPSRSMIARGASSR